jgi:DNA gyrase subunit A
MQLRAGDVIVGMVVVRREATLATVTEQGYAKRTAITEYRVQQRGGMGTITLDVSEKSGPLVAAKELLPGDELMVISASGAATRLPADEVPEQGRATQGKRVLALDDGDRVVEVSRVAKERETEGTAAEESGDEEEEEQLELMKPARRESATRESVKKAPAKRAAAKAEASKPPEPAKRASAKGEAKRGPAKGESKPGPVKRGPAKRGPAKRGPGRRR